MIKCNLRGEGLGHSVLGGKGPRTALSAGPALRVGTECRLISFGGTASSERSTDLQQKERGSFHRRPKRKATFPPYFILRLAGTLKTPP